MWPIYPFLLVLFSNDLTRAHPRNVHEIVYPSNVNVTLQAFTNRPNSNNIEIREMVNASSSDAESTRKNSEVQSVHRPRFLMTYGNAYKPNQSYITPVDPFQNILLYFLMNFGREFSQSPIDGAEEGKMRRPPDFFGEVRSGFADVAGKINATRDTGQQVQGKYMPNGDVLEDDRSEEIHIFPHAGGTCMCFNHLERRSHEATAKHANEATDKFGIKQIAVNDTSSNEVANERSNEVASGRNNEVASERNNEVSNERNNEVAKPESLSGGSHCQRFRAETTELKTENHNEPSSIDAEKSTVSVNNDKTSDNNTIIKVLRIPYDKNKSANTADATKATTAKHPNITGEEVVITGEEIVVDLQLTPEEQDNKRKFKTEAKPPFHSVKKISETDDLKVNNGTGNKTKNSDEGYYFLSYSGGTEQRTTASNKVALYKPGANLIPPKNSASSTLQRHMRDSKSKRTKRVRRRLEKIEKYLHKNLKLLPVKESLEPKANTQKEETKIEIIREELRNKPKKDRDPSDRMDGPNEEGIAALPKSSSSDVGGKLVLPESLKMRKDADNEIAVILPDVAKTDEKEEKFDVNGITNLKSVEGIMKYQNWEEEKYASQQSLLLTATLPTFVGVGVVLLLLCYIMRTKGWCCQLFTDKSRLVFVEVGSAPKEVKT